MPVGPRGEKRPKNPNAAAHMVGMIATGRMEEQYVDGRPWTEEEAKEKRPVQKATAKEKKAKAK